MFKILLIAMSLVLMNPDDNQEGRGIFKRKKDKQEQTQNPKPPHDPGGNHRKPKKDKDDNAVEGVDTLVVAEEPVMIYEPMPYYPPVSGVDRTAGPNLSELTQTFTVNGVRFDMVRVDGGTYDMGGKLYQEELPIHSETVKTFYIGKTEVTQKLWQAVMGENPSTNKGDNLPVETVSWDDCIEFVNKLSRLTGRRFRIPTEVEWEFAARGGNWSLEYKYCGSHDIDEVGWYLNNSGNKTHPVAQKKPNELGLYDMSGNVWEWCADQWSSNHNSPRIEGYRVNRGCGFNNINAACRPAFRTGANQDGCSNGVGLRLAL